MLLLLLRIDYFQQKYKLIQKSHISKHSKVSSSSSSSQSSYDKISQQTLEQKNNDDLYYRIDDSNDDKHDDDDDNNEKDMMMMMMIKISFELQQRFISDDTYIYREVVAEELLLMRNSSL